LSTWEIIADNLSKAGWSWGWVSAADSEGRTIWIADAHRGDGKRFVVRADEKLTAFWNLNWRPALAANCVDRLAFFFQNWPSLNSSKSDAGSFPREVLRKIQLTYV